MDGERRRGLYYLDVSDQQRSKKKKKKKPSEAGPTEK